MRKSSLFILCIALTFLAFPAFSAEIWEYEVRASKLENSRNELSLKSGNSAYSFDQKEIENLPQGQATSINQVLLRGPGVTQDSYGQLHIRSDHSNLQYRINDVIIPEGVAGFGQTFDAHFADSINLLTGVLPAQYGYRTAGVVDIKTKQGRFASGGYSEILGGSNQTIGANQQLSGSAEKLNYFISASYLQNNRGLEPPTAAKKALHDETKQNKLFGYFSYLIDVKTKLSLILATAQNHFQIPNNPNQTPEYNLTGVDNFSSSEINEKQRESNQYAILSLQGVSDTEIDYQFSAFTRLSTLDFRADNIGDLIFNGVASDIDKSSWVNGLQGDLSKKINDKNTVRFGVYFTDSAVTNQQNSQVFSTSGGTQTSSEPFTISDGNSKHIKFYSLYLQDEWKAIEKLTLNFGARFDALQGNIDEHQISPRFGAVYALDKKTKLHAGFARYFTPPKAELILSGDIKKFENTTNEPENFINDKVRAERSNYYDAGLSHKLTPYTTINLDGYYKDVKNLLDEGQFGNALIFKPFNYREAKIYGVEFSADYKKDNLSAFFNLALQRAKARNIISSQYLFEQDELDFIAKNYVNPDHAQKISASAGAAYKINHTKFGGDVIFGSGLRRGFANTESLPSYAYFNIFAVQKIEKFDVRFSVNNLFDKVYKLRDGSGIGVGAPQYGLRRSFYLIISRAF